MLQRSHYIVLVLVVLFVLALMSQSERVASRLKQAISGLFLPLFGLANTAQTLADQGATALLSRPELQRRLQELQVENQRLQLQGRQWEELTQENVRLRDALQLPRQVPWKLKPCQVVGRDPANWWRSITINSGTRGGITNNLPVLSPQGFLVGRVSTAGFTQSEVVLLGDPDCRVSVLIESTRDHGIIAPSESGPIDTSFVELKYLPGNSEVQPGQWVRTSGLGGIFPKGILVGQVADVRNVQYGLHLEARAKLTANLSKLEEVWVILP